MIKRFRHKGLRDFFETGSKAGIQAAHFKRLRLQLARLDAATSPADMNLPGWDCNWRMTFAFEGEDAVLVDYRDYH